MDVTHDGNRVQCCKEQYCTGTWNVRPMNQGKLKAVRQEIARVNIDNLGISELKWTRWENLIQVTIRTTIMGKYPLEEMEYPSYSTKESEMQYLGAISKMTE